MKRLLIISLLFVFALNVKAATVNHIFTVTVNSYQLQGFNKKTVFLNGLEKVVYKLTGINNAFKDKRLVFLKNISNTLVQKFSSNVLTPLERRQWNATYKNKTGKKASKTPYSIVTVSYAEKPIVNYLKRNKIPFWTKIRPKSVFWIIERSEKPLSIMNKNSDSRVKNYLFDITGALGLPITYPILDELDRQRINVQMLKDSDINTVSLASQRYNAFNTVIVDINFIKNAYVINWTAKMDNVVYVWDSTSSNLYKALKLGVIKNVYYLLKTINEGIESDIKQKLVINVANVNNYKSMAIITKYLNSLPKLSNVVLTNVNPTRLQFSANLAGTLTNVKRYMRLQDIIRIDEDEILDIDNVEQLYLQQNVDIVEDDEVELNVTFR